MTPNFPHDGNIRGWRSVTGDPMAPGMLHSPGQQGAPAIGEWVSHSRLKAVAPAVAEWVSQNLPKAVAPGGQVNSTHMGRGQHLNPAQQQQFQQLQFQQQSNNPQAMAAMRQQQQLLQQQHARQSLMAQHAFHANMQNSNGVQREMQPKQLSTQQLQQLTQSGRLGPQQHPQAQAIMNQQLALQQQQQQEDQRLALEQQQRARQQRARQMQMQGSQSQIVPQEAEAQNVSHGAEKKHYYQDNTRHWMMESALNFAPYTPPPIYSTSSLATSERSSNILEPTRKNRSIHATISKDHTAGDDAQSAVSFAKFGQKIQWRACPTFERKET